MTKQELVNVVAQEVAIPQKTVNAVLESVIGKIKSAITSGDDVSIRGFGTFTIKHRAEKKARDIQKGTTIIVPAKDVPSFKPSKQFFDEN